MSRLLLQRVVLSLVSVLACALHASAQDPLNVYIRAGAKTHGPGEHDHPRFLEEWRELLAERGCEVDGSLEFPAAAALERADVLVMYAAEAGSIHGQDRAALDAFLARGGGLVVLHDAVCGNAPHWWKTIIGGAWEHGVAKWHVGEVGLYFADTEHPITRGIANFDLRDEIYYEMHVVPEAHVLANSFHTVFDIRPQMWTYEKDRYRAFVSLQGHFHETFSHPAWRSLVLRGIAWAGRRDADTLLQPDELEALEYPEGGPLPPDRAHGPFELHEDFEIELVASEPHVINPISIDWDARERMWVALTPGYPYKEEFSDKPAHDEIVILEDTDGDGRMDRRRLFHEGLDLVTSLVLHEDGVLVAAAPDILHLRDTDGDDVCDVVEKVYTGFGYGDTHATISNFRWGLDGWVYGTQGYSGGASNHVLGHVEGRDPVDFGKIGNGLFRFKPDGTAIEMVSSYGSNTWGLDFTEEGELFFTMANGSHLRHIVLPDPVLERGRVDGARSWVDVTDHKRAHPISKAERHPYLQIDFVGQFTGAAGCMIYNGASWPEEYRGQHFVTEPTINIVHRDVLRPNGSTYVASRAPEEEECEFLASTDLWFRPVHLRVGPDGHVYLLDFYNQAAVHNDTRGPQHGRTNAAVRPDRDRKHGRIWRISHKQSAVAGNDPVPADLEPADLVAALGSPNGWRRDTAARLLRQDDSAPTTSLLRSEAFAGNTAARVAALWTLRSKGLLSGELRTADTSEDPVLRRNVARMCGPADGPLVRKLLRDDDARTRLWALVAAGEIAHWSPEILADVVANYASLEDPWQRSAATGACAEHPLDALRYTLAADADAERLAELAAQMARRLARDGGPDDWTSAVRLLVEDGARPAIVRATLRNLTPALERDAAPGAVEPLVQLLASDDLETAVAAVPFVARWGGPDKSREIDAFAERLVRLVGDEDREYALRLASFRALMNLPAWRARGAEAAAPLLAAWMPEEVQQEVVAGLGGIEDGAAAEVLLAAFPSQATAGRERIFNEIVKRASWSQKMLDLVEEDELSAGELGPHRVFRLKNHPDGGVAERARGLFAPPARAEEIEALIARLTPVVSQPGDVGRGKELFAQQCGTCHTFKGEGAKVGPELDGMGVHGPAELLPFILDPNRAIEEAYVEYVVRTVDGLSLGGRLVSEGRDSITLRNTSGDVEIQRADIDELANTGRSPMPTGFEELGEEGLRDVLAYLCADYSGYRAIDLREVCTSNTETGLYDPREPKTLEWTRFGVHEVAGVPYDLIDPYENPAGMNVIVLKGGLAQDWHCKLHMPRRVEVPVGFALKAMHVLGGIGAWAFPYTQSGDVACTWTWVYADGEEEAVVLIDGREFSDWIRRSEVPGSTWVDGLRKPGSRGQIRRFVLAPSHPEKVVEKVVLESPDNHIAATFVALTAQLTGEVETAPEAPVISVPDELRGAHTLMLGGGSSHDYAQFWAGWDVDALQAVDARPVRYTDVPEHLDALVEDCELLILCNNQPIPGSSVREKIFRHVERGRPLLLLHAATWYNWADWPEYNRRLVGGGARSHESFGTFDLSADLGAHPLLSGLTEGALAKGITDELYRYEPDESEVEIEVLMSGTSRTSGKTYPVLWTVSWPGEQHGRILCCTLGHDDQAHAHPVYSSVLRKARAWLTEAR